MYAWRLFWIYGTCSTLWSIYAHVCSAHKCAKLAFMSVGPPADSTVRTALATFCAAHMNFSSASVHMFLYLFFSVSSAPLVNVVVTWSCWMASPHTHTSPRSFRATTTHIIIILYSKLSMYTNVFFCFSFVVVAFNKFTLSTQKLAHSLWSSPRAQYTIGFLEAHALLFCFVFYCVKKRHRWRRVVDATEDRQAVAKTIVLCKSFADMDICAVLTVHQKNMLLFYIACVRFTLKI